MDNIKIDRINTLAHKAKSVGLTEEEKKERDALRKEYIATIRMNLRSQLDNISIKEEDGSITNLGEENRFLQREKRVLIKKYRNGAKKSQKISLLLRNIRQRTESLFMQITIMK